MPRKARQLLTKIVVVSRGEHALGLKSTLQIVAKSAVACRKAVTAQKAMEEGAKVASLFVEAAREAARRIVLEF